MKSRTFMEFEVLPQTPLEGARNLASRLEKARELGYASEMDSALTRVTNWNIDYTNSKITIKTATALFPKPSLSECEMFKSEEELFKGPYLSVIGQVYTGKNPRNPEKYLVHVRSKKTFQGSEKVSAAYAGYCEYITDNSLVHPVDVAVKEFKEEIKRFKEETPIFVQDLGNGLELIERPMTTLDFPMHFMGKQRIRNPLLSFVNYVDPKLERLYPTVENLGELNGVCQDVKDFEIMGVAWIPYKRLSEFWEQVRRVDRVYSVSNEICDNLMAYFDILSK